VNIKKKGDQGSGWKKDSKKKPNLKVTTIKTKEEKWMTSSLKNLCIFNSKCLHNYWNRKLMETKQLTVHHQ